MQWLHIYSNIFIVDDATLHHMAWLIIKYKTQTSYQNVTVGLSKILQKCK